GPVLLGTVVLILTRRICRTWCAFRVYWRSARLGPFSAQLVDAVVLTALHKAECRPTLGDFRIIETAIRPEIGAPPVRSETKEEWWWNNGHCSSDCIQEETCPRGGHLVSSGHSCRRLLAGSIRPSDRLMPATSVPPRAQRAHDKRDAHE